MPQNILCDTDCYIELKVNKIGENKIISDQYINPLPLEYTYDDEHEQLTDNRNFNFTSTEKTIKLFWSSNSFSDFSYMFSGLTNIIEVKISHMFRNKNNTLSYMFKDCINLVNFTSDIQMMHILL